MSNKPNILFLFTDDQRFDTIRALGNKEISTPNLDKLVARGTSFNRAHIPCGTSGAVCMPSRAMLHTGRTLFHLQGEGQTIPGEHITLGEVLQNNGYRTFGTGKWHNGTDSYARSFTDGGEIMFGGMGDHWNVEACDFDAEGNYSPNKYVPEPFASNEVKTRLCDHINAGKHSSELFCEAARDWLQGYESDQPFFMYISFMAPHDPRTMPDRFLNMYDPEDIILPENFKEEHPFDFGVSDIRDEVLAPYPRTPSEIKRHIAEYYAMITHLDHEIGKVLKTLEDRGMADDTIIVFAGDNGLALGQHGLMGKQNLYEHSIRVPLIFAGPGVPAGETRRDYTYLLDIYPTLCDLVDIDIPQSVEGKSLKPVLDNPESRHRNTLYFAYTDLVRGVRDERYKLIEYATDDVRETQLFATDKDPRELNNLAGQKQYQEIEDKLKQIMLEYKDKWDDEEHPQGKQFWNRYRQQE